MAIIRVSKKENPFAQIDKTGLYDARLSWDAKAVLCYLLTKPDDWEANVVDIACHSSDGITVVRSALKELQKFGYVEYKIFKNSKGQISEKKYIIYEVPITEMNENSAISHRKNKSNKPHSGKLNMEIKENEPHSTFPNEEKPDLDKPNEEKPDLDNLKHNNNEYSNIENNDIIYCTAEAVRGKDGFFEEKENSPIISDNTPSPQVAPPPPSKEDAPVTILELIEIFKQKGLNGKSEDYANEFWYAWNAKEWFVNDKGAKMKNVESYLNKFLKSKEPKQQAHPAYQDALNFFFEFYEKEYKRKYKSFNAGDGQALNQIIFKLEKEMIEKQKQNGVIIKELSKYEILQGFQFLITKNQLQFVKENFTLKIINTKFDEIINSIRNGKSNSYSKSKSTTKTTEEISDAVREHLKRKYGNDAV